MSPERFLDRLVASARRRAAEAVQNRARIERGADTAVPRDFLTALTGPGLAIIAEAKQQSPSRGRLAVEPYDPAARARAYELAGARAMSVLTEPEFFLGSLQDLKAARAATAFPLLRKDFILDPVQVAEARAAGGDAVLAIVRILSNAELRGLLAAGAEWGLTVLVEVHNREELERALSLGAMLVGVNNRDLDTFETRLERCLELAAAIPPTVTAVAESGLKTVEDLRQVYDAGYQAALIGEQLMVHGTELLEAASAWR